MNIRVDDEIHVSDWQHGEECNEKKCKESALLAHTKITINTRGIRADT